MVSSLPHPPTLPLIAWVTWQVHSLLWSCSSTCKMKELADPSPVYITSQKDVYNTWLGMPFTRMFLAALFRIAQRYSYVDNSSRHQEKSGWIVVWWHNEDFLANRVNDLQTQQQQHGRTSDLRVKRTRSNENRSIRFHCLGKVLGQEKLAYDDQGQRGGHLWVKANSDWGNLLGRWECSMSWSG